MSPVPNQIIDLEPLPIFPRTIPNERKKRRHSTLWFITAVVISLMVTLVIMGWHGKDYPEFGLYFSYILKPGEKRPVGILETYLENSPAFRKVSDDFRKCMERKGCNVRPILIKRDQIIREEWPWVFDILFHSGNWDEAENSQRQMYEFFRYIDDVGQHRLRNMYRPKIDFIKKDGEYIYRFNGYVYDPTPLHASGTPAGGFLFYFETTHDYLTLFKKGVI